MDDEVIKSVIYRIDSYYANTIEHNNSHIAKTGNEEEHENISRQETNGELVVKPALEDTDGHGEKRQFQKSHIGKMDPLQQQKKRKLPFLKNTNTQNSNDIQRELKTRKDILRRLQLLKVYRAQQNPDDIDALIDKWQNVIGEVAEELREVYGPMIRSQMQQKEQWDGYYGRNDDTVNDYGNTDETSEHCDDYDNNNSSRNDGNDSEGELTYKRMFEMMGLDIGQLGNYNVDDDQFF